MYQRLPAAKLVEFAGDEHSFWLGAPAELLDEIERFFSAVGDEEAELDRVLATVLFTDIVGSTDRLATHGDRRWHELLDAHNAKIRSLLARSRGSEVDTAGDAFLATFDGPIRVIRCAIAATEAVREIGLEIRAGLHAGEVELFDEGIRGIAGHIGARVASLAGASEVFLSSTVKDLVAGPALQFEDVGEHALKGVQGQWRLSESSAE